MNRFWGENCYKSGWRNALRPVEGVTLTPEVINGDGDLACASAKFTLDPVQPDAGPINMVGKWQVAYKCQADGRGFRQRHLEYRHTGGYLAVPGQSRSAATLSGRSHSDGR